MREFLLDEDFIRDVYVEEYKSFSTSDVIPEKYKDFFNRPVLVKYFKCHDMFSAFREYLHTEGYIEIKRNWINGDVVLKQFSLNGMMFNEGDRFPCAAALAVRFKVRNSYE